MSIKLNEETVDLSLDEDYYSQNVDVQSIMEKLVSGNYLPNFIINQNLHTHHLKNEITSQNKDLKRYSTVK